LGDAVRSRVVVRGRVQGVFFRGETRDRALRAGVCGWVRNCADGSVEAVFEGEAEAVASLVAFCRRGPRSAQVCDVEVLSEAPEGLRGFEIRR
jgi:acylphosphatase